MTEGSGPATDKALRYAYRALSLRPLSEKELRTKLKGKGFGSDLVEAVAGRVRELGYLNDAAVARQLARTFAVNRLWGNYRIERALKEKGLAGDLVEEAIAQAREEMTERAAVAELLRKKGKGRTVIPEDAGEKRRIMQSLMGKGFPPGLIFEMLSISGEEEGHDGQ